MVWELDKSPILEKRAIHNTVSVTATYLPFNLLIYSTHLEVCTLKLSSDNNTSKMYIVLYLAVLYLAFGTTI